MSNPDSLRKALEFIKRHCANIIRTNSRDRDDWAEDMAYVGKVAADALSQPVGDHVADAADAARYRWLRRSMAYEILCDFPCDADGAKPSLPFGLENWPSALDAAVDEAMVVKPPPA